MAQVTVKINGYSYMVGCEDGQEPHLIAMAAQVESRVDSIKALGNTSGEARLLVLAALLLSDELHDVKAELEALRAAPAKSARPAKPAGELAKTMTRVNQRAEEIAAHLERP